MDLRETRETGGKHMSRLPYYQFYAELDDYKPEIWRRFQVRNDITVARLGYIVQVLFEMTASHLMAIEVPKDENFRAYMAKKHPDIPQEDEPFEDIIWRYEIPDDDAESFDELNRNVKVADATAAKLRHIISEPGEKLQVNYDFGDDWWVTLILEKEFEDQALSSGEFPRVIEGEGFGIVEDVGGVPGLTDFTKAFKAKNGAEYENYKEWFGADDFDMAAFDIDDMNFRLKKIPRIYKQSYEDGFYPTQRSIDLIERKYKV
jgi:hypothetical protein